MPRPNLLESPSCAQNKVVSMPGAHDLHADRKTRLRQPHSDCCCRIPRHIERDGQGPGGGGRLLSTLDLGRERSPARRRVERDGRCEQEVVVAEEIRRPLVE